MNQTKDVHLLLAALLLLICSRKAASIHVEGVVVPPMVIAGQSAELRCLYKEEGDELYSLKWWRGDDHFYQYIPPSRSSYSIPGVRVNMSATISVNEFAPLGLERVVLDTVGLDTAGVFKCEVMADRIFETVFKEAKMTVIVTPPGSPMISGYEKVRDPVSIGQRISLTCSVPPATPPPAVSWKVNNHPVRDSDWVTYHPLMFAGGLAQVVSSLDFVVTQKMIDESIHGLVIECDTRQPESSYSKKDTLVLIPERTSYFWFFFSRGTLSTSPSMLTFALAGLLYRFLLWSTF